VLNKIDLAAIDRVLDAVGHHPIDLDRAKLAERLGRIARHYRGAQEIRTRPADRQKLKTQIVTRAKELRELVDRYGITNYPPQRHSSNLDYLIQDIENEPMFLADIAASDFSANEYLVSMLQAAFEQFFCEAATYTRDQYAERVKGAFIDFAEAVIQMFKVSFSREAIARALSKTRKVRGQGKRRGEGR
jgi:hypothetical protein